MKKTLCLILAALMLAPAFLSCSEKKAEETAPEENAAEAAASAEEPTLAEEEPEEEIISDDLPACDFEGYEYVISNTNLEANDWYTTVHVTVEEDSGDAIPSAIFNRNIAVEDRFNIKIIELEEQGTGDVRQSIQSGDGGFDIVLSKGDNTISLAQQGFLMDMNKMEYLNFEKPYWDTNAAEQLSIAGKLFDGVGDFLTTHIDETICMYFNKQLIKDFNLENPYDLIHDYKWTYDKMGEMGQIATMDKDGNGVLNDQDNWALLSWRGVLYPYLIYGSGESYMKKNTDDIPEITFFNDRFIAVYEKICSVCHSNGDTFTYDADTRSNTMGLSNNHRVQEIMFPNNQALFWVECVSWARALREMETDFGIIVCPMFDEAQQHYYNYVNSNFYGVSIPVTVADLDRCTIVLEGLNSASTKTVLAAYYDITLKSKYSRDEESSAMLDLIFDNRLYDCSVVFALANISGSIYPMASNNDTDLASYYNKSKKSMTKQIEKAIQKISELE